MELLSEGWVFIYKENRTQSIPSARTALMNSISAGTTHEIKDNYEWCRRVRADSPPANVEEYLQNWESFFDHYAAQIDEWQRRNSGYHRAIASLGVCAAENFLHVHPKRV